VERGEKLTSSKEVGKNRILDSRMPDFPARWRKRGGSLPPFNQKRGISLLPSHNRGGGDVPTDWGRRALRPSLKIPEGGGTRQRILKYTGRSIMKKGKVSTPSSECKIAAGRDAFSLSLRGEAASAEPVQPRKRGAECVVDSGRKVKKGKGGTDLQKKKRGDTVPVTPTIKKRRALLFPRG